MSTTPMTAAASPTILCQVIGSPRNITPSSDPPTKHAINRHYHIGGTERQRLEQRCHGDCEREASGDSPSERALFEVVDKRLKLTAEADDSNDKDSNNDARNREHHVSGNLSAPFGELGEQRGQGIADHTEQSPIDIGL